MIFTAKLTEETLVKKIYDQSMKELDEFFGLNWKIDRPKVFIVQDRKSIDEMLGQKTPDWIVGWSENDDVFVLSKENYEKESSHKYSDEAYFSLIKHELTHVFTKVFIGVFNKDIQPDWLWEGLAIYLSGQTTKKEKPKKFKEFIECYTQDLANPNVYQESGFAVQFLIENFGKIKLLKLLKTITNISSEEKFNKKFEEIYGFELNYENFVKADE